MRENICTETVGVQVQADAPRVTGHHGGQFEQLAAQRIDLRRRQLCPRQRDRCGNPLNLETAVDRL